MVHARLTPLLVVSFCALVWSLGAAGAYRLSHHGEPGLRHAIVKRVDIAFQEVRHLKRRIVLQALQQQG